MNRHPHAGEDYRSDRGIEGSPLFEGLPPTLAKRRPARGSRMALERNTPARLSKKAIILLAIEAAGTRGMTRWELHGTTGISENSVNGRVRELLDEDPSRVVEHGERDGRAVLMCKSCAQPVDSTARIAFSTLVHS